MEEINDKEVKGKILFCERAQKMSERQAELRRRFQQQKMERLRQFQGVNLYIKNLEKSIDDTRLRREFESYGTITSVKVMRDDKGNSKGIWVLSIAIWSQFKIFEYWVGPNVQSTVILVDTLGTVI